MLKEDFPMAHAGMATDIEAQKSYYKEGKIFILQIESTLKCQQCCKYCYADSRPTSPDGMPSDKIIELLNSAKELEIKMIDWLGGDPLIRDDWYELCKYALDLGLINNIWTSGIPMADREVAKKAVEVTKGGFISTHLDTIDPTLYLQLHGCDDVDDSKSDCIELILRGINNVLSLGKSPNSMVNCITYTRPLAKGDANTMISYMHEKYNIKTCLTLFNPVIHRSSNLSWEPLRSEIREAFSHRDKINYPGDPSCGPMDVSKFYCGTVICIKADGWLTPCSVINTREFGNVYDNALDALVKMHRKRLLFLDFRDPTNLPGNCPNCINNSHCFGCRSSAYYYAGDVMAADPKCFDFTPQKN
jgi:MoaA/NifB/PqqE/SkfB family radical SAM enzyme